MLRLVTLLLSCVAVCAQPVLSLNDPTVVAKSSSLLQGLVGYWQLEESSGTRYDRSPYGNHLTAVNSPGSATGKVGNCGTFVSSSSQYLSIIDNASLSLSTNTSFTVTMWFKATTLQSDPSSVALFSKRAGYGKLSEIYIGDLSSAGCRVVVGNSNAYAYAFVTNSLTTNTWNFIASSYNGTSLTCQINTNSYSTNYSGGTFDGAGSVLVGCDINSLGYFNGSIDEIGFWKRALSSSEITQLYRSGLGVTYPRFSMRDNRADDFDFDTWEPIYDKPKPFPTLYAFVNRREPEPLLTICE